MEYLEVSAGTDSLQDRYYVGLIAGLNSVLNMSAEELTQEDDTENDS